MILIIGDLHCGKGVLLGKTTVGSNLNSRIDDQFNLLDWTLEQAIENNINNIIVTGDVFEDPKPAPFLISLFISWLKKCQINNINVHIVVGNHDILRNGYVYSSSLDIISEIELNNVSVYKDINTIIIDSTAITFMPFRDRKSFGANINSDAINILKDSLIYELAGIPATYKKIIIGHLAIEGSIPVGDEIDDIANELFCPISMFEGYDYVWMGHVHKPQIMKKKNPYIAHIGSMDISNFGEGDHKKIIVTMSCESSSKSFETIEIPTRKLKKICISVPKETADSTNYVLKEINKIDDLNKSIVKLEIDFQSSEIKSVNKSIIQKYLMNDKGVFNISNISESKKVEIVKKDSNNIIDTKMDVKSAIKNYSELYVDEKLKDKFVELALDIYNIYKLEEKT